MRTQNALAERNAAARRPEQDMMPFFARVIAVYPDQNQVDVALSKGGILRRVSVLRSTAGSFEGSAYLPSITNPPTTRGSASGPVTDIRPSGTDTYAVVAFLRGDIKLPVVLGFLPPEHFATSFPETLNVEVNRHRNGMYVNYGSDGVEISHPSGTFIRIGVGITKTDLNGKNADSGTVPFADTDGTASATPDIIIKHNSGASIRINTAGSIIITKAGGGSFVLETHQHVETGGTTGGPV